MYTISWWPTKDREIFRVNIFVAHMRNLYIDSAFDSYFILTTKFRCSKKFQKRIHENFLIVIFVVLTQCLPLWNFVHCTIVYNIPTHSSVLKLSGSGISKTEESCCLGRQYLQKGNRSTHTHQWCHYQAEMKPIIPSKLVHSWNIGGEPELISVLHTSGGYKGA